MTEIIAHVSTHISHFVIITDTQTAAQKRS